MSDIKEAQIIKSWDENARPWIDAIKQEQIESRIRVTNHAICNAVTKLKPNNALDVGCGEGWLVRYLISKGIDTVGIDGCSELIEEAKSYSVGEFYCVKYSELDRQLLDRQFDVAITLRVAFGSQISRYLAIAR